MKLLVNSLSHPPIWFYYHLVVPVKIKSSNTNLWNSLGHKQNPPQLSLTSQSHKINFQNPAHCTRPPQIKFIEMCNGEREQVQNATLTIHSD